MYGTKSTLLKINRQKFLLFIVLKIYKLIEKKLGVKSGPMGLQDSNHFPECQSNDLLESGVTFVEFNLALKSRMRKASPGPGGIDFLY